MKGVQADLKGLDELGRILKEAGGSIKVGVFEDRNATVGLVHEYGSMKNGIKKRSWLRMPLENRFYQMIREKGIGKAEIPKDKKSVNRFMNTIGGMAVASIFEAFATNGFGTWVALNAKYWSKKKVKNTLVESQQLRDSIKYEVNLD